MRCVFSIIVAGNVCKSGINKCILVTFVGSKLGAMKYLPYKLVLMYMREVLRSPRQVPSVRILTVGQFDTKSFHIVFLLKEYFHKFVGCFYTRRRLYSNLYSKVVVR